MKIVYVTDLQGNIWKYEAVLEYARSAGADMIINGGDMFPKGGIDQQKGFIADYLDGHFRKVNDLGIYYVCMQGNDDFKANDDYFDGVCDKYHRVVNIAQRIFRLGDYEFIGMNWVADYPFRLKDRCRVDNDNFQLPPQLGQGLLSTAEGLVDIDDWQQLVGRLPSIADELEKLPKPDYYRKSIFIIHTPPANLGLDVCGDGRTVGSQAVYSFLSRYQPLLSLHGHIHESPEKSGIWHTRLNQTTCIQPGQLISLSFVTIDLPDMTLARVIRKTEGSKQYEVSKGE